MLYFYHTPKLGPARAMLIERLCYYRGCYYRGSTVQSKIPAKNTSTMPNVSSPLLLLLLLLLSLLLLQFYGVAASFPPTATDGIWDTFLSSINGIATAALSGTVWLIWFRGWGKDMISMLLLS